ncbi:MAG: response regulator transcription factor, partial [Acidobacteria bacterium]|nr:response regulator transcription factor [Acidobacteriota bacterium]
AWNGPAEALFGVSSVETAGKHCGEILEGMDECGPVCSPECSVRHAALRHHPVSNFDLQVRTPQGMQWCNISTMHVNVINSTSPYSVHIIRGIDMRKRMELLMRDFIVNEAKLPAEDVKILVSTTRSPSREVELTDREIEVLRLLAKGSATKAIAELLHISRITVSNHIQHILKKLNAHSRLEAIRRAERAGLI